MKLDEKYFRTKLAEIISNYDESGHMDSFENESVLKQIALDAAKAQRENCRKRASLEKCWIHCVDCPSALPIPASE